MAYQEQWNGYAAAKVQSGIGSQASSTGATIIRQTGGVGGRTTKAAIESQEVRRDGMSTRGRHGLRKSTGAYTHEYSVGGFDDIMQAVMRGTWGSADLAVTEATAGLTSITTGANTIVAAAGSWITAGFKVGDVCVLTGHSSAGNNSRNLRITGVTALTLTVAETLTVNAVADTAFTLTRTGRVLVNPGAGALVKRYFTVEEYEYDTDQSEVFTDCVWGSFKLSMRPNGLLQFDTSWVGTGQTEVKASGSSPHFTSPATPSGVPLAVVEATIRMGGIDLLDLTSFDITVDNQPVAPDVISASPYSPAVFSGSEMVTMNLTALRKDLVFMTDFLAETPYSLHILATESESEPKSFVSIMVPNFTLGSVDKSALAKSGGPRTQSISVPAALVGVDNTGAGYDATQVKIQVSNAT
ncbi:phage tail tube protein [Mesorhizobium sp. M0129]|uniref:phage tail tube protein n=1 Tax=Mesorhizobium sp. M0129 TaxID=2956886 RepID=UPI00333CCE88